MTLATRGTSHRRRGLLALAAFFAVFGAILAGAAGRPSEDAHAVALPLQAIILCKEYASNGPNDDLGRTFAYPGARRQPRRQPAALHQGLRIPGG